MHVTLGRLLLGSRQELARGSDLQVARGLDEDARPLDRPDAGDAELMVERLEPRPAGRPPQAPKKTEREQGLEQEIKRLKVELEAAKVRAELSTFLP